MYSINFDFFFNLVYNFLLAIRYAFLFWILRIDPQDYLADHKFDTWDGLRDRGWITSTSTNPLISSSSDLAQTSSNTVYLGQVHNSSWFDIFKTHIFGNGVNTKFVSYTGDTSNYSPTNSADVNFAVSQVRNDPWFYGLHLSIQNPILSFFADILSTFAFFISLILIYTIFQWLYITLEKVRKEKDKVRKEKLNARIQRIKNRQKYLEEESQILKEEKFEEDFPAGVMGLPIDEQELDEEEKEALERNKNNLLNYKDKNKKDSFIKMEEESKNIKEDNEALKKLRQYKDRWNIVLNYANGVDEALWRVGILEAENLLEDLLKDRGYEGESVSDRLANASFNTIDLAWAAHKIRNRIAHDGSRFVITERIAKNTFDLYKAVFTEFKIFE